MSAEPQVFTPTLGPLPPGSLEGLPGVAPRDPPPAEMETLRMFVNERLTAAVDDILELFGRTVSRYREQIDLQRRQLETLRPEEGSWGPAADPLPVSSWIKPCPDEPILGVQLEQTDVVLSPGAGTLVSQIKTEKEFGVEDFAASEPNGVLNSSCGSEGAVEGRLLTDCSETEDSGDYWRDPGGFWRAVKEEEAGEQSSSTSSQVQGSSDLPLQPGVSHQPAQGFSCKVCGESYQRISHLLTHASAHLRDCGLCGKHLQEAEDLKLHIRVHRKSSFCCNVCGQSFTLRGNLRIHMMIHSGERPYPCDVCGKSFGRRATLVRHVRSHTGEKPFICTYCGHSFSEKGNLTVHLRTHTGERPYWCSHCDRRFSQMSSFHKHPCQRRGLADCPKT